MLISMLMTLFVFVLVLLPLVPAIRGKVTAAAAKKRLVFNLCAFGFVMLCGALMPVFAAPLVEAVDADVASTAIGVSDSAFKAIAAALAVGLAGIGGGLAVGPAASAAIGAMSEDSSTFGKSLIFVALGEGIAIYGLLVAFLILFVY